MNNRSAFSVLILCVTTATLAIQSPALGITPYTQARLHERLEELKRELDPLHNELRYGELTGWSHDTDWSAVRRNIDSIEREIEFVQHELNV